MTPLTKYIQDVSKDLANKVITVKDILDKQSVPIVDRRVYDFLTDKVTMMSNLPGIESTVRELGVYREALSVATTAITNAPCPKGIGPDCPHLEGGVRCQKAPGAYCWKRDALAQIQAKLIQL